MKPKWTAAAVVDALRVAYGVAGSALVTDEWAFLTEVPLRAAGARGGTLNRWSANERTIDVMLVRSWSGKPGFRRIAVEVKVSRSDYRNEHELKRQPAEVSAHQCYYATPAGLLDPSEIHDGWGLFEVYADARSYAAGTGWPVGGNTGALVKCRVRPADRTPTCDLDYLVSAYARRASRAEERIRRGEEDAALVPRLRAEVESLTGKLVRRDDALRGDKVVVRQLRDQLAAMVAGQVCADCREPVTYRLDRGVWEHTDPARERSCYEERAEADRRAKEAEVGARYIRGWPGPVEPLSIREAARDTSAAPVRP